MPSRRHLPLRPTSWNYRPMDLTTTPSATDGQIADALLLYITILEDSRAANISLSLDAPAPLLSPFFLAIHDYCPSIDGKSNILFAVLHALFPPLLASDFADPLHRDPSVILPRARHWLRPEFTCDRRRDVYHRLQTIANDLIRGFFVPMKAAGGRTPVVSPLICVRSHGDVGPEQGTPGRLGGLRAACLHRDQSRCVVTRNIDWAVQEKLVNVEDSEESVTTEVAHIIPHSFNSTAMDGTLGESRTYIWRVMNMFDPGISQILRGLEIDSPYNAMTLCQDLHSRFGRLKWYLEPTRGALHTYTMHVVPSHYMPQRLLPLGGIVTFNATGSVPPPSLRLLAFHRACCLMLSMSGAGECADRVLRDMGELSGAGVLAADGTSDIAQFWKLKEVLGAVLVC